ncbi:hybrid sensor histidine kinase/response regulator [Eilatimonas milleporae]|uniref:histidine kinase n=1 Tax=Eilatimonas milleporae TaxID=911205 RepID=A0A3M0CFI6_9PROT|nr:ATP-binding protein [Eilatimonas milleporae]RMB07775.1 signal transduction histidine kinase [Eilatimonas milleporae]
MGILFFGLTGADMKAGQDTRDISGEWQDAGSATAVPARWVAAAVRLVHFRQLPVILGVFGAYYAFITLSHAFALEGELRLLMMALSLTAAGAAAGTYALMRARILTARHAHAIFLPAGVVALVNVYLHICLTADQIQMTNGILALLAYGFVMLSPRSYWLLTGLSMAMYVFSLFHVSGPYGGHFAFMLVPGVIMGTLAFYMRLRATEAQIRLLLVNRARSRALAAARHALEHKVVEAESAADAAEKANRAKSVFLANASHELRTPLTGIIGMLDLLRETGLERDQADLADTAHGSARGLLVAINDLLDLSQLEAGRATLTTEPFIPCNMARTVMRLLQLRAEGKGVALVRGAMPDEDDRLFGDPVRIGQILYNLVDNAVKFTDAGEVRVSLHIMPGGGDERLLVLEVADTGIGVTPEDMARLFRHFDQLSEDAAQRGGAGLGLALCQELVQLMNGRIRVESRPEGGTRFTVEIPLCLAAPLDPDEPEAATAPGDALRSDAPDTGALQRHRGAGPETSGHEARMQARLQIYSEAGPRTPVQAQIQSQVQTRTGISTDLPTNPPADRHADTRTGDQVRSQMGSRAGAKGQIPADPAPVPPAMIAGGVYGVFSGTAAHLSGGGPVPGPADILDGGPHDPADDNGDRLRILVAEDNPVNKSVIERLLARRGWPAAFVVNGREAVDTALAPGADFDAILMDIRMPVMDGVSAAKSILAARPDGPPVIALTANTLPEEVAAYAAAGMVDVVPKPIDPKKLYAAVRAAVAARATPS